MKVQVKQWNGETIEGQIIRECEDTGLIFIALANNTYGTFDKQEIQNVSVPEIGESESKNLAIANTSTRTRRIPIDIEQVDCPLEYEYPNSQIRVYCIPRSGDNRADLAAAKLAAKNLLLRIEVRREMYGSKSTLSKEQILRQLKREGLQIDGSYYRKNDVLRIVKYISKQ